MADQERSDQNSEGHLDFPEASDGTLPEPVDEGDDEVYMEKQATSAQHHFRTEDVDGNQIKVRYTISTSGKCVCSICHYGGRSRAVLRNHHREKHLGMVYTCCLCETGFSRRPSVRKHFMESCPKRSRNLENKLWDSHPSCQLKERPPAKNLSGKARGKLRVQKFEDRIAKAKLRSPPAKRRTQPYTPWEWEESPEIQRERIKHIQGIKPTVFDYNFREHLELPLPKVNGTKEKIAALDESSKETITEDFMAMSSDGVMRVTYLPDGLAQQWPAGKGENLLQESMEAIRRLEKVYPPPKPKGDDIRHSKYEDLVEELQVVGLYHFAIWVAKGQLKENEPFKGAILSKEMRETEEKKAHVLRYHQEIAPLIQTIAMILEAVDPETSRRYCENYDYFFDNNEEFGQFRVSNRAAYHGHVLLRNLCAEPHTDPCDARDGLVVMCCFGDFEGEGGQLVLHDLGITIEYKPGSVIVLRSAQLMHSIQATKKERSSLVFFTHGNVSTAFEDSQGI